MINSRKNSTYFRALKKTDEMPLNHSKIHDILPKISPNGSPGILKKKKLTIYILFKPKYLKSQEK
ncbi:MAG: hypothetical protein KGD67_09315 [Candidatus Lokiarchaeota archaeon]|nr:hypothetical protein [Candidatus Lokiarchaeota archaeon]